MYVLLFLPPPSPQLKYVWDGFDIQTSDQWKMETHTRESVFGTSFESNGFSWELGAWPTVHVQDDGHLIIIETWHGVDITVD